MGQAKELKLCLPQVELGKTGISLSRLGLGGFHQCEISSEVVEQVVDAYLGVGGNYIETARGYGDGASEDKIGRALEGRRDQVVLCSKSGALKADEIRRDLETSLGLLRTDHIEFYYFHGINTTEQLDKITAAGGALEGLQRAQDEGLITGMGLSSHRPWMYAEGMERLPAALILIWSNYLEDMYLPEITDEIFPYARQKNVGITAMKPLADGFLYRSPRQAIRYALGSGSDVLVCGMNSPAHVYEAAEAVCEGPASEAERDEILHNAPELGDYVCRQCGECSDALMELFRLEGYVDRQMIDYLEHDPANYALRLRLSGWFDLVETARNVFKEKHWDQAALLDEATTVSCPYKIQVHRKTRIALAKLRDEDTNLI